jgi:3-methyladenine DNA glycosylase Mpg
LKCFTKEKGAALKPPTYLLRKQGWTETMISEGRIIPSAFYDDATVNVARKMLGTYLVRRISDQWIVGRIVEAEAYLASGDLAAHNVRGITKRTEVLYGASGYTYVHSLRQHHCLDVVAEGRTKNGWRKAHSCSSVR